MGRARGKKKFDRIPSELSVQIPEHKDANNLESLRGRKKGLGDTRDEVQTRAFPRGEEAILQFWGFHGSKTPRRKRMERELRKTLKSRGGARQDSWSFSFLEAQKSKKISTLVRKRVMRGPGGMGKDTCRQFVDQEPTKRGPT